MMSSPLKNIAIVGASGTLGTPVLSALLASNIHNITVVARRESTATFPSSVTVKKGDYNSASFLYSAFSGQNVLILILPIRALDGQTRLIAAASKAGVKYVLPTEYGSDTGTCASRKRFADTQ